ncbi:hypothetical protein CC1G_05688 [Coprinopsis cinerea okayama7|uniref:C2H2-type domain-containing protein n=1 Tax=Coprinopsis cinerea (strain Okayama-7 / 130 / ATCC MYA-4618 / FGSC 9003) TaxID=240176 RepID=A8N9W1_COPC7|nr:hypothetical protein CC1G_05688 [Coprinopsis cinerea okayama7\|eukprot:XP_001831617.1 hypothetical protein CC1G_05688 [Coprinopsis cinerea okayama7\
MKHCNSRNHRSSQELLFHLEKAHLDRVSLDCPVAGCHPTRGLKNADLKLHLAEQHSDVLSRSTTGSVPVVKDTVTLRPFKPTPPSPPPFPVERITGLTTVARNKRPAVSLHSRKSKPVPRHPRQLPMAQIDEGSEDEDGGYDFDDLESFNSMRATARLPDQAIVERCMILGRPDSGLDMRLSQPPPMLDADLYPYRDPPRFILFDAFSKRVAAMPDIED